MKRTIQAIAAMSVFAVSVSTAQAMPIYWNLFNTEDNAIDNAVYATYSSFNDMLTGQNNTGLFTPDGQGAGEQVVGSGAFFDPDIPPFPVPEPGTLALFGLGFAGLVRVRRRKAGQ